MLKYYVTATDKFFSGWGEALNKINKLVIECETYSECQTVFENLKSRNEMKYVNWTTNKPKYDKKKYLVTFRDKESGSVWFK